MGRGKIEKRGSRRRNIKPIILIVTEGSKTEPKYFEHFRNHDTNIDIRVVGNRSNGGETDYVSLLKKAQEYQIRYQLSSTNGDSAWIIADGDVNLNGKESIAAKNNQLEAIRKMAMRTEIEVVISNPCFELWYLLHFRYTTRYFQNFLSVKSELLNYLPDYEKSGDAFEKIEKYTEQAIHNAKKLEQYHIENSARVPFLLDVNPFTEVYKLVEILCDR